MRKLFVVVMVMLYTLGIFAGCRRGEEIESEDFFGLLAPGFDGMNYLINDGAAVEQTAAITIEALARTNRFGVVEHALADRWTPSQGYSVWEVRIRRGVGWYNHEGVHVADITADCFVAAMEFILNEENNSAHFEFVSRYISSIEVRSENTVVYRLYTAVPYFPSLLTTLPFLPVNRAFLNEVGEEFGTSAAKLLFSGSHIIYSWDYDGLIFVRNESYHLADRVHVERLTLLREADNELEMFREGRLSQVWLSMEEAIDLMDDPDFAPYLIQTRPQDETWFFALNFGSSDTNVATAVQNVNFRRAVFAAINRDTLINLHVVDNRQDFLTNTISAEQVSFNARNRDYMSFGVLPELSVRYTYNPARAVTYIHRAVVELGDIVEWPVTLVLPREMTEFGVVESELYRQMIEAALDGYIRVEFRVVADEWNRADLLARGELDIGMTYVLHRFGDPSDVLGAFAHDGLAYWLFYFDKYDGNAALNEMFESAAAQTDINARFSQFVAFEAYLIENAMVLPFKRGGGGFMLSREIRPFYAAYAQYGLSQFLFLDRAFGEPVTAIRYAEMFGEYQRLLGYLAR